MHRGIDQFLVHHSALTNSKLMKGLCCCLSCNTLCSGAGQDVGRSCILLSISGKNIMLDCGMHMGFNDEVDSNIMTFLLHMLYDFLLLSL